MKMMADRCGDSERVQVITKEDFGRCSVQRCIYKLQQLVVSQCLLLMFAGQEIK